MTDIAVDPALAQIPHPYSSHHYRNQPVASTSRVPANDIPVNGIAEPPPQKPSGARPAIPEDPSIRPYGCNAPGCLPSLQESKLLHSQYEQDLTAWNAEHARMVSRPETATQRPRWRHPSLRSSGVCFNASKDLLEHVRETHNLKSKHQQRQDPNSIPVHQPNEQTTDTSDLPEDGRMFRCAMVGCQRSWKNCNGLQYHVITCLTAEEHTNSPNSRQRTQPSQNLTGKRKAGENDSQRNEQEDNTIHYCPYRNRRGCTRHYKHRGGVRHHMMQHHANEPDLQHQLENLPPATVYNTGSSDNTKKPRLDFEIRASAAPLNPKARVHASRPASRPYSQQHQQQRAVPRAQAPVLQAAITPPYSGMYSHGYVFSGNSLPFRPAKRPVDALYYLNVLCSSGEKTSQQRSSERTIVNALLNAELVKALQVRANQEGLGVDLFDDFEMMKAPEELLIGGESRNKGNRKFGRTDAESAIAKLAKTLSEVGFGDALLQ